MSSIYADRRLVGRPPGVETERRTREFLRLVAQGVPVDQACLLSRLDPMRALRLIAQQPELAGLGMPRAA